MDCRDQRRKMSGRVCRCGFRRNRQIISWFELKRLYIFHRFHGNGLGKRLLQELLSFAKDMKSEQMWLQVHEANHHAIDFYKRKGSVQTGTDLYRAGKGAYQVLRLELTLRC